MIDKVILRQGIETLGLSVSDKQLDLMDAYAESMIEKNKVMNLTRITEPMKMLTDHFLDSLTALSVYTPKSGDNLLDIGTGAGFPGAPIAIMCPDVNVTMLDSTGKKIAFIEDTCEDLGIDNVSFIVGRAEEEAHNNKRRENYDVVVARAVSDMKVLSEIGLGFVKLGGTFLALKSNSVKDEIRNAYGTIQNMGGKVVKEADVTIPISLVGRTIVEIEKVKRTQGKFPRSYQEIIKK